MGARQSVGNTVESNTRTAQTPKSPVASPKRKVYECNGILLPETERRHAPLRTSGDVIIIIIIIALQL